MRKFYFVLVIAFCLFTSFPALLKAQTCNSITATTATYESRCAATGSIKIVVSGGSGSYKYKVTGPVNSNYTTADSITGLGAGTYTVVINDIVNNCTISKTNVVVAGTYLDPRFSLNVVDVSCDNGSNGSISVTGQQNGRSPFTYSIEAPSPMGVGTSNSAGVFNNLIPGDYSIRLTDSCGGIQTRTITLNNYTWWLDDYQFTKTSCDSVNGFIKVVDSRGNVSTVNGIAGFMYGVVRHPGDTILSTNPNFSFFLNGASSIDIVAKDACGKIKKGSSALNFNPTVGAGVNVYGKTCNTFSVSFINLKNFFGADYCLYDNNNIQIACNNSGVFNSVPYGNYCLKAHNSCPDTTISRCINVLPPPISVGSIVLVSNKNCTTFTATVTGQVGLTNPDYCIYDAGNTQLACNTSGIFTNLSYGTYCITIKDNCQDTTISRCFTVKRPTPKIPAVIAPAYIKCSNFGIVVNGDSLFMPQFCLFDSSGVKIVCNNTGIFDSLSFGNYCVSVYDACYDTTITRCFFVGAPVVTNDLSVNSSNKGCTTFTVNASTSNVTNPQFCLYNNNDSLIACNSTGIFNSIQYGTYCVKLHSPCPDTLFTKCITVTPLIPSASSNVSLSNKTCTTFTASISGQKNLTNPNYCLFDSAGVQIRCSKSGSFSNLAYGSYCIKIINTCYDTTITRCFTAAPVPVSISVSTAKSCSYGFASLSVSVTGGGLPVVVKIYKPDSSLLFTKSYNYNNFTIDSIPGLVAGQTYKIIASDNCGYSDSLYKSVIASIANHSAMVTAKCPSAMWQNGSGRIEATTATNMGVFTVNVIKKNSTVLSPQLSPNSASGGVFIFDDLEAATYVISYKLNDACNKYLYDTVVIKPYTFPNLNRSSAYQCDVSGFSVGAVVSNGVGPFSYQIIGSTPSSPSILSAPQSNPVFSVDNGTNYSLIRLRALDACGNATLADASILPLANYKIIADSNCFQSSSTLSVDTIYNATYSWYKKDNANSIDSTYLGAGYSVFVPYVSANDTGTYICHVIVNTGCVKRTYKYNLTGLCYSYLPTLVQSFYGKFVDNYVLLNWKASQEVGLKTYVIERKNPGNDLFIELGRMSPNKNGGGINQYEFKDVMPLKGNNIYRLRMINDNGTDHYSNTILLSKTVGETKIIVYPNPVNDKFTVSVEQSRGHNYKVSLYNLVNQVISEIFINGDNSPITQITRKPSMPNGVYILKCVDLETNQVYIQRLLFK